MAESHTGIHSVQQLVAMISIFESSTTASMTGVHTHYPSPEAYNTP